MMWSRVFALYGYISHNKIYWPETIVLSKTLACTHIIQNTRSDVPCICLRYIFKLNFYKQHILISSFFFSSVINVKTSWRHVIWSAFFPRLIWGFFASCRPNGARSIVQNRKVLSFTCNRQKIKRKYKKKRAHFRCSRM